MGPSTVPWIKPDSLKTRRCSDTVDGANGSSSAREPVRHVPFLIRILMMVTRAGCPRALDNIPKSSMGSSFIDVGRVPLHISDVLDTLTSF